MTPDQIVEMNLGKILTAIMKQYDRLIIDPKFMIEEDEVLYKLVIDFNDETQMFELSITEDILEDDEDASG
jgi:hypothetical protein